MANTLLNWDDIGASAPFLSARPPILTVSADRSFSVVPTSEVVDDAFRDQCVACYRSCSECPLLLVGRSRV